MTDESMEDRMAPLARLWTVYGITPAIGEPCIRGR